MVYGPGPFHPPTACASDSADLMSLMYELTTLVAAELRAMPRFWPPLASP
jgi:hypothetical protein